MRSICALVCASSLASAVGKWRHHARDREPRQTHRLADRHRFAPGRIRFSPSRCRYRDGRRPAGRAALPPPTTRPPPPAAHLFLHVELPNRLLHLRFERHSQPQQGNFQPDPANRLRFRIGADAEHVGARLHRNRSQRLEPMAVGIGLHDHAELRGSDEPPQILNVIEEVLAGHENLNVMLSHFPCYDVFQRRAQYHANTSSSNPPTPFANASTPINPRAPECL